MKTIEFYKVSLIPRLSRTYGSVHNGRRDESLIYMRDVTHSNANSGWVLLRDLFVGNTPRDIVLGIIQL